MANYNEMIGETVSTDGGDYSIVAHVHDDGNCDGSINLYVGRAADGHCDLIASDNASMWLVGSEDDAELNRDQWNLIAARCDIDPVLDAVRDIDAELADWLHSRYDATMASINDRINPYGRQPHNPVLRWVPGHAAETITLESALVPPSPGYTEQQDYCDPYAVWGDDGTEDMLDRPLSDNQWTHLLDCVSIR